MGWSCSNYLCLSSSSSSSSINSNELTRFNICKLSCEYKEQRRKDLDLKRPIHISAYNNLKPPSYKLDKLQKRKNHISNKPTNISAYYSLKPPSYKFLVKKHKLEISQPGLDPSSKGLTWKMTRRREDLEFHKVTEEKPGWCSDPHLSPCAAFVEIVAPVFSRDAWRCVWHIIQRFMEGVLTLLLENVSRIGVVDVQWITHQGVPSLGNEGIEENGKEPLEGVRERCKNEWKMFQDRLAKAERDYYKSVGVGSTDH